MIRLLTLCALLTAATLDRAAGQQAAGELSRAAKGLGPVGLCCPPPPPPLHHRQPAVPSPTSLPPSTGSTCTPIEVPAYLPLRDVALILPTLRQRCSSNELQGLLTEDFLSAKLCCSHTVSPVLPSALVAGYYDCDNQCVFNPSSAALLDVAEESAGALPASAAVGSPLLGWRWDAVQRCWQEEAEDAPQACNLTSASGEAAVEHIAIHLRQAVATEFLLSPLLAGNFSELNATRQVGRALARTRAPTYHVCHSLRSNRCLAAMRCHSFKCTSSPLGKQKANNHLHACGADVAST